MSDFKYQNTGEIKVKENFLIYILREFNLLSTDQIRTAHINKIIEKLTDGKLRLRPFRNSNSHNYNYYTDLVFHRDKSVVYSNYFSDFFTTYENGLERRGNDIYFKDLYVVEDQVNNKEYYNNRLKEISSEIQFRENQIEELKKETETISELLEFMKNRNVETLDKSEYQIWKKLQAYNQQSKLELTSQ